jgi:isopenicillin-N N-acyltransferase-like protein
MRLYLILFFFLTGALNTFSLSGFSESFSAQRLKTQGMQRILYLKGTPYELGYQQGQFLKEDIASNIRRFIDEKILANPDHPQIKPFLAAFPTIVRSIPEDYRAELKGLAEGAQVSYEKVLLLNLFPEMFHCHGITVKGQATRQGELYHVRALDYSIGQNLQDTAVLLIVEPEGKIPFLNVSYAGFIGCITGMNAQHIALGEIGGKGYGEFGGMPMAFLLRHILEKASTLKEVKEILANTPRTCEYYYLFSDGKQQQSFSVYATHQQLHFIEPGTSYALFDRLATPQATEKDSALTPDDKLVLKTPQVVSSDYQTVLYQDDQKQRQWGLIHRQPADCLILTGFPHPHRYPVLIQRLMKHYGQIGVRELKEIIKEPVALPSNLHNAIFAPATLDVWVAHAGPQGEPACDQPYEHFNLADLIRRGGEQQKR